MDGQPGNNTDEAIEQASQVRVGDPGNQNPDGGRRRRHSHHNNKKNPWLRHVKETMRKHRGVSFKKILKIAKKTFKKSHSSSSSHSSSHSSSQSAGRRGRNAGKRNGNKSRKSSSQSGGSGMAGKAPFGENAAAVV